MSNLAVLKVTDGTTFVDLLGPGSGFKLADPYWNPQVAQFKGGGDYADSRLAEGRRLVHKEPDNVVETIPLSLRGTNQNAAMASLHTLLNLLTQAADYHAEPWEYDCVWLEARLACEGALPCYSRVVQGRVPELTNPYGQPFYSTSAEAGMEGLSLVVEREPYWRAVPPGEVVGVLYNLLKNPDFEQWNFGAADSQPDCWSDLETLWVTGQNSRQDSAVHSGDYALKVRVSGSTQAGATKGVTQVVAETESGETYTFVGWVRSDGVSNGVGRILITSTVDQHEAWRSADAMGWTLVTHVFTIGTDDVVGVNAEILTTAANTDGTCYFDSFMLLKGDWHEEAEDGALPYMTSSHIVNHWDQPAGAIVEAGAVNWVDAWDVPGDVDALVRLEFTNDTSPADHTSVVEKYAKVRIGQRRTGDVQAFQNYNDPVGGADATCSSGDRLSVTPTPSWTDITTHSILGEANTKNNAGRYRVLARVYDAKASGDPTLQVRLLHWIGVSSLNRVTLEEFDVPVRAQWCMADLTDDKAMVWDLKGRTEYPGQLGYVVQFCRPTGSGDARLDYSVQMPTDGGYLVADVAPSMEEHVSLIVDNTSSQTIEVSGVRQGSTQKYALTEQLLRGCFVNFKGSLYTHTNNAGATYSVYKKMGLTWTKVLTTANAVAGLGIFNEKLYALLSGVGSDFLYSSADGDSWTNEATLPVLLAIPECLKSFNGLLWVGGDDGATGYVYYYDGTNFTLSYTVPAAGNFPYCMEVYQGKLFVGTGSGGARIYVYDPTLGWSLSYNTGEVGIYSLQTYKGKLYAGTGANGYVYVFDGSTWALAYDPSTLMTGGGVKYVYSMGLKDDYLIVGITHGVGSGSALCWFDGATWEINTWLGMGHNPHAIGYHEGTMYLNIFPIVGNSEIWWVVLDEPVGYGVPEFQGGAFTAPNRRLPANPRRHRWVFSYDRESYVNVTTDKARVGLGYVPRFLTLRGSK